MGSTQNKRDLVKEPSSQLFDNQIEDRWLTSREAAEYLRVSVKTLLNMVSSGEVAYSKLGRRNRYRLTDLRSLLMKERRGLHGL